MITRKRAEQLSCVCDTKTLHLHLENSQHGLRASLFVSLREVVDQNGHHVRAVPKILPVPVGDPLRGLLVQTLAELEGRGGVHLEEVCVECVRYVLKRVYVCLYSPSACATVEGHLLLAPPCIYPFALSDSVAMWARRTHISFVYHADIEPRGCEISGKIHYKKSR